MKSPVKWNIKIDGCGCIILAGIMMYGLIRIIEIIWGK